MKTVHAYTLFQFSHYEKSNIMQQLDKMLNMVPVLLVTNENMYTFQSN